MAWASPRLSAKPRRENHGADDGMEPMAAEETPSTVATAWAGHSQ